MCFWDIDLSLFATAQISIPKQNTGLGTVNSEVIFKSSKTNNCTNWR